MRDQAHRAQTTEAPCRGSAIVTPDFEAEMPLADEQAARASHGDRQMLIEKEVAGEHCDYSPRQLKTFTRGG